MLPEPPTLRSIATARLTLEPQVTEHAEEMFALLQDPAIYQYENEPPASIDGLRQRFARLESRTSADGRELWLNWVLRLSTSTLIGYVQATVRTGGCADIAYVLASRYWGRGFAGEAVQAMLDELAGRYDARTVAAVLKRDNVRSIRLLERLGFRLAAPDAHARRAIAADEILMQRDPAATD